MKRSVCFLVVLLTFISFSFASSESSIPDLVGVWKTQSEAAILVVGKDDSKDEKDDVIFKKADAETVIEKQQGRVFSGYFKSPEKTEKLVGVIGHDNKTVHWSGRFGFGQARIVGPGKMETIYLQWNNQGSQAWFENLTREK